MALAGVEGAVGGDAGDLLVGRDLVEKLGQHRRVTDVAGGELGRPDLQGLLVNSPSRRMFHSPAGQWAAEGAEVRHGLVQTDQMQQALDEAGRLPHRHAEQRLHRQAGRDRGIALVGLSATFAGWRGLPDHGGIEPDRQ